MQQIKQYWHTYIEAFRSKPAVRYGSLAAGSLIVVALGGLMWLNLQPAAQPATVTSARAKKPEAPKFYSPLTGTELTDEALTKRHITAVMIENSPDARPQSGLKEAGIVYEAIAEGGITRFLAVYQESRPGLVGPVRSVRPYYVEWGAAYDAGVAHIGGSAKALQMVRSGQFGTDLDQFFNAGAYWRASDRAAPHNVYTNFDKLDELSKSKEKSSSSFTPIARKADTKQQSMNATVINLPISSATYNVDYTYNTATKSYERSVGGAPHEDREQGRITPKVVVAMQVSMTRQLEDGYREQIVTTGSGRTWVFQDGVVTEGTWERPDVKSQPVFKDGSGKVIALNRGQTWITALPNEKVPAWR